MHKQGLFLFFITIILFSACDSDQGQKDRAAIDLQFLWESDSILTNAESVIYDSLNDVLFVSCIQDGPPDKKDNDGFISMVSPDSGKIRDLLYIVDLSAPKGMSIWGDLMYVTDIDELVMISLDDAIPIFRNSIDSSLFLKDLALGEESELYISDPETNAIHVFQNDSITKTFQLDSGVGPNGLLLRDGYLLYTGSKNGTLNHLNLSSGEVTLLADSLGQAAGITSYKDQLFVSSLEGVIYHVSEDGLVDSLLRLEEGVNAADIAVIENKNLLLVPTFSHNTLRAYKIISSYEYAPFSD